MIYALLAKDSTSLRESIESIQILGLRVIQFFLARGKISQFFQRVGGTLRCSGPPVLPLLNPLTRGGAKSSTRFGVRFEGSIQSLCEHQVFFCAPVCEGSLNLPQKRPTTRRLPPPRRLLHSMTHRESHPLNSKAGADAKHCPYSVNPISVACGV
jgi:hypothetical protein